MQASSMRNRAENETSALVKNLNALVARGSLFQGGARHGVSSALTCNWFSSFRICCFSAAFFKVSLSTTESFVRSLSSRKCRTFSDTGFPGALEPTSRLNSYASLLISDSLMSASSSRACKDRGKGKARRSVKSKLRECACLDFAHVCVLPRR